MRLGRQNRLPAHCANWRCPAGALFAGIMKYLVNGNLKVRWRNGKSHGNKETRGKYSKGKFTRKQNESVYGRQGTEHGEADTVVSGLTRARLALSP